MINKTTRIVETTPSVDIEFGHEKKIIHNYYVETTPSVDIEFGRLRHAAKTVGV
jgi:hypothetical protein